MGNYKFKLSDMIPNAWFYKLKDMNRVVKNKVIMSKKQTISSSSSSLSPSSSSSSKITDNNSLLSDQRKSYHFTRDLTTEPPRKSSKKRRSIKRNRPVPRLVSAGCSCRATLESVWTKANDSTPEDSVESSSSEHESMLPEYGSDTFDGMLSMSTSCECKAQNDIVIEVNEFHDSVPELKTLPPIITKKQPTIQVQRTSTGFSNRNVLSTTKTTNTTITSPAKRFPNNSPGLKLRTNTPKIANRRINQGGRKSVSSNSTRRRSVSESFAVVKSSKDPRRDFRESMVEMIVENNIRGSKDLEELLACYLSLNSDEYHELIINVFKQIWFDFVPLTIK